MQLTAPRPDGQEDRVRRRPPRHRRRNPRRRAHGPRRPRQQVARRRARRHAASPPWASPAATATSSARARRRPTPTSASSARSPPPTPVARRHLDHGRRPRHLLHRPRLRRRVLQHQRRRDGRRLRHLHQGRRPRLPHRRPRRQRRRRQVMRWLSLKQIPALEKQPRSSPAACCPTQRLPRSAHARRQARPHSPRRGGPAPARPLLSTRVNDGTEVMVA